MILGKSVLGGLPEGIQLIRYGVPSANEFYLNQEANICVNDARMYCLSPQFVIVPADGFEFVATDDEMDRALGMTIRAVKQ